MIELANLLGKSKDRGASDLLVMVGDTPVMRVAGKWARVDAPRCSDASLDAMARAVLQPAAYEQLIQAREIDFSFSLPNTGRVRCNAHFQRDHLAMVFRLVWPEIPDSRILGIPQHVIQVGEKPNGLVLVCGPTGSGKSTTLAAIVENINTQKASHIITIEDPIEFIYKNRKSIIEQREIGSDTASWHAALRNVLRQAPDVIVLGELRDLESIAIALTAAETGHLVMASVHSSSAAGAISRIVDVFPPSQSAQVRLQLSQALRMVFAQQLVPGKTRDSRILLYEILVGTPAVANLIRSNEIEQLNNAINSGREHGMISFAQCHRELAAKGVLGDPSLN